MTKKPKDQKHDNWTIVILRYHPVKFGSYRFWESGDIAFLKCHVTPRDQEVKRSTYMTAENKSSSGIFLPSLGLADIVKVEIKGV